ncbi:MAG: ferric reductase-like transmembrane domain-containing protein [Solirubrobacterales bacterium]
MAPKDPTPYLWWLVSRSAGIVALGLVTIAVLLGLTMSTKLLRRPGVGRTLMRLHEHVALVALAAIVVHGLSLLGDHWLAPGLRGIAIPFAMSYRPLFTGLGIVAGYLAALLALSFYVRRRIGVKLWRKLHRATVLVWALGVLHTLGAGSDAATQWLRAFALLPAIPIAYLLVLRVAGGRKRSVAAGRAGSAAQARERGLAQGRAADAGRRTPAASRPRRAPTKIEPATADSAT